MASPVAHSLVALGIYYASHRPGAANPAVILGIAAPAWLLIVAANLPDFDLIPGYLLGAHSRFHRTFSHSILICLLASLPLIALARYRRADWGRLPAAAIMIAVLSHILLDWLTFDAHPPRGIELFWPFSQQYFMSEPSVFINIRRDNMFQPEIILHNIKAVTWELLLMAPLVLLARVLTKVLGRSHHLREPPR